MRNDDHFGEYVLAIAMTKIDEMHTSPSYKQIKYRKSSFQTLCQTMSLIFKIYVINTIECLDKEKLEIACLGVDCFHRCLSAADILYERKFMEVLKMIGEKMGTQEEKKYIIR